MIHQMTDLFIDLANPGYREGAKKALSKLIAMYPHVLKASFLSDNVIFGRVNYSVRHAPVLSWCHDNLHASWEIAPKFQWPCSYTHRIYYGILNCAFFENENDAMMFKLFWL
jgi:hypothetical protein